MAARLSGQPGRARVCRLRHRRAVWQGRVCVHTLWGSHEIAKGSFTLLLCLLLLCTPFGEVVRLPKVALFLSCLLLLFTPFGEVMRLPKVALLLLCLLLLSGKHACAHIAGVTIDALFDQTFKAVTGCFQAC